VIFNEHLKLANTHAFLSASSPHWVNYTDERLVSRFRTALAAQRGTELHAWAAESIRLRRRQPEDGDSISQYINDAIGFRMSPEKVLFYSYNCYGTADVLSFREEMLRIHDLKTGVSKSSIEQLYVYAALFCLEYGHKPYQITTELRIYQSDEIKVVEADPDHIAHIMDKIMSSDRKIEQMRMEEFA
jgi:Protein of unknown function (DUF2800)